jgi:hypothetical protein
MRPLRLLLPLLIALPSAADAQASNRRIIIDIVFTSLDDKQAQSDSIKASGWGYQIGVEGKRGWIIGGGAFGQFLHKDLNEFTVGTTGGNRKSGGDIWNISGWLGLEAPGISASDQASSSSRFTISAVGGYTQPFMAAVREGIDCGNCPERALHIQGGMFVEPGLKLFVGNWQIGGYMRTYFGGDLRTVTGIRLAYTGND